MDSTNVLDSKKAGNRTGVTTVDSMDNTGKVLEARRHLLVSGYNK
jgi:hypothetical protein